MSPDAERSSTDTTRRQLLAAGGTALATSLAVSTAGCVSGLPPLGDGQRYGRLSVPSASDPTYRKCLPAPSAVEQAVEDYHFVTMNSTEPRPGAPEKFVAGRAHLKASLDYFGIGFANYDRLVSGNFGTVIEATFPRPKVVQTIENSGYENTDAYRGYTTFARSDVPRRVAVGDDVVVWTSAYHHESPNLEALVDARTGSRARYHEETPEFNALTTAAGGNPYLGVNTEIQDPTGRPVMMADAFRFDDDIAYQVVQYYYRQADRVPTRDALERALKDHDYRFIDGAEAFDVELDDRLATVETRVPVTGASETPSEYVLPQVTWGASYDADNERVTLKHHAGESVPAERLFYDIDRPSAPGKIDKRPLWSGTETVESGMEATIDLSDDPGATGASLVYSAEDVAFHSLFGFQFRGAVDD
ncbi:hypothetical protein [Halobellus rufus]|uniref:hypothetical protein n=1 Tax=Halobellus rufus TaxID=1448860 RepID=UPI0018CF5B85|nr:hypothetical protein [Halobellus rufus]